MYLLFFENTEQCNWIAYVHKGEYMRQIDMRKIEYHKEEYWGENFCLISRLEEGYGFITCCISEGDDLSFILSMLKKYDISDYDTTPIYWSNDIIPDNPLSEEESDKMYTIIQKYRLK